MFVNKKRPTSALLLGIVIAKALVRQIWLFSEESAAPALLLKFKPLIPTPNSVSHSQIV